MKVLEAVTQVALALEELAPKDRERVLRLALELNDELHGELESVAPTAPKRGKKASPPPSEESEVGGAIADAVEAVRAGATTPSRVAASLGIEASAAGYRLRKARSMGLLSSPKRGTFEVA